MNEKTTTVKAALISALFALVLAVMLFVPVWFVLAFLSRLMTGQIRSVTFVLAGAGAIFFLLWVFRLAFGYFQKGYRQQARR